jgi:hypothetical protein
MFASPGLYALAGLLQWHLELRLNALTGSLLALSAVLMLWTSFSLGVHFVGAALLVGIVFYQRREISLPGRAGVG